MQDSLAVHLPAEVRAKSTVGQRLILEFWKGTAPLGTCELPIPCVREAAEEQARLWCYVCKLS